MPGIVYLLTNPAMPNMVKIGKTTREDPSVRMGELYATGVPLPFECKLAMRVENESEVEKILHIAFGPYRVNAAREFFEIDVEQAYVVLEKIGFENVTPEVELEGDSEIDIVSKEAVKAYKKHRPNLNFLEMGIPIGSLLLSIESGEAATVISGRKVLFREEEVYLTQATKMVLDNSRAVAPTPHWTYEGRSLQRIYNETY